MKKYFFKGVVSHRRVKSKKHGFDYPYRSIFLENIYDFQEDKINHIKSTFFNFSFLKNDDSKKILNKIFKYIKENNISKKNLKINLLKTPDFHFLKTFNPVCFWFLETDEGCKFFTAEVENTFHEKQMYVIENKGDTISQNIWLEVKKNMYVSPFAEKSGFYKFNLSSDPLEIKINQFNKEKKAEIVTNIRGSIIQAKGLRKFRFYIGLVSSSLLVLVRIHIQAFILWLKRFKIFPHGSNGYAD